MWKANSLKKTLMLGKIEGRRKRGQQMSGPHSQLNEHEFDQALGDSEGHGSLKCCSPWGCRVRHNWVTEQPPHNHQAKSSFRGIAAFTIMIMKPLADSRSSCYRHRVHKRAWISLCDSVSANTVFLCAFISKLNSIFKTRAARKYRKFTFMLFQIFFYYKRIYND